MTEDIVIEIIQAGDEIDAVIKKDGRVYVYPLDEVREIIERLDSSGASVIDKTVEGRYTVYSQEEEYFEEDFYPRDY